MFAPSHTAQFISTAAAILYSRAYIRQPWLFRIPELLFDSRDYIVFQSFYSSIFNITILLSV